MNAANLTEKAVLETPDQPRGAVIWPLSPREGQVIHLIDGGLTSKEVAFELGVADATVRVLRARALRKLGRATRRPPG